LLQQNNNTEQLLIVWISKKSQRNLGKVDGIYSRYYDDNDDKNCLVLQVPQNVSKKMALIRVVLRTLIPIMHILYFRVEYD